VFCALFVCFFFSFFAKKKRRCGVFSFFLVNSSLFSYSANVRLRQGSCKKKDACMCPKEMDIGLPLDTLVLRPPRTQMLGSKKKIIHLCRKNTD
jgi:hypothetical protein